ncbi:hypothetical protein SDC9_147673 [bioreactor metagenome]|uniref:Uncharacterized protein n=1 Tax=bioreactor metagenome TaxID=1076179 RepID=A0A645EEP1_9ZZZZ
MLTSVNIYVSSFIILLKSSTILVVASATKPISLFASNSIVSEFKSPSANDFNLSLHDFNGFPILLENIIATANAIIVTTIVVIAVIIIERYVEPIKSFAFAITPIPQPLLLLTGA